MFLDNKLITNHSPGVPVPARFSSVAETGLLHRPGDPAWRSIHHQRLWSPGLRPLFSCPRTAQTPSSQTLESSRTSATTGCLLARAPHATTHRETDVTWACYGCRPFSALPCLLDPGERCQHQDVISCHRALSSGKNGLHPKVLTPVEGQPSRSTLGKWGLSERNMNACPRGRCRSTRS